MADQIRWTPSTGWSANYTGWTTTGTTGIIYRWDLPSYTISTNTTTFSFETYERYISTERAMGSATVDLDEVAEEVTEASHLRPPVQRSERRTVQLAQAVVDPAAERRRYMEALQQAEMEERQRQHRDRERRIAEHQMAQQRALGLLRLVLTEEEFQKYESEGVIEITGTHGGRYRIRQDDYQGNVVRFDADGDIETLCAHPQMGVGNGRRLPNADAWVGQILALKSDERAFFHLANVQMIYRRDQNGNRMPFTLPTPEEEPRQENVVQRTVNAITAQFTIAS